jgi:hypothetical protein
MARFGVRSGSLAFARSDGTGAIRRFERTGAHGREHRSHLTCRGVVSSSPIIRARGEARRGVRSVGAWQQWQRSRFAWDRTGSAAFETIPANWEFQRTGATGRERSLTDRTQEVAGSSPASSIQICRHVPRRCLTARARQSCAHRVSVPRIDAITALCASDPVGCSG